MRIILLTAFILAGIVASAQQLDDKLANKYFNDGEYEKAAILYKELWDANRGRTHYYDRYFKCLLESDQYAEAERQIDSRIKKEPKNSSLMVKKASIFVAKGQPEMADEMYQQAIDKLSGDLSAISQLGHAFQSSRNYDYAIKAYERGIELTGDSLRFANQLRALSQYANDKERLMQYSLLSLVQSERNGPSIKAQLQRYLDPKDHFSFQKKLFVYIQNYPDAIVYPELLQWSYVQQKDYESALRQARALDRKLNEGGQRVYTLGQMAANNGDYDTAIDAYSYILEKKSKQSSYYLIAKSELLKTKRNKILTGQATQEELDQLESEYYEFIGSYGKTSNIAYVLLDLARFQNRYQKNADKAMETLNELVAMPGVNPRVLANAKLELGDLYLLIGERWEASLLYSQVDKDFPEEDLGETARYKNALLSYYVGDFEWAQEQFDILKASTSKLISNDAIDRSVFIMDNLGLDTTAHPMMMYATAELKIFQRRYDEAFEDLNVLANLYDGHGLEDDVHYLRANAYVELDRLDEAVVLYHRIASEFPDDIRADNSLHKLAKIYEDEFDDLVMAANLYQMIFIEYSGSTFAIESRKKYRDLISRIPDEEYKEFNPLEKLSAEDRFMRGLKVN